MINGKVTLGQPAPSAEKPVQIRKLEPTRIPPQMMAEMLSYGERQTISLISKFTRKWHFITWSMEVQHRICEDYVGAKRLMNELMKKGIVEFNDPKGGLRTSDNEQHDEPSEKAVVRLTPYGLEVYNALRKIYRITYSLPG